ncbi:nucleotide sugar dehydrogenase [Palleronia rufa]|uniref:nucleotide sugar dehydrogenase n=1 Tax=Palleronia rufa TaxID=1530186 RepID=UPI002E129618
MTDPLVPAGATKAAETGPERRKLHGPGEADASGAADLPSRGDGGAWCAGPAPGAPANGAAPVSDAVADGGAAAVPDTATGDAVCGGGAVASAEARRRDAAGTDGAETRTAGDRSPVDRDGACAPRTAQATPVSASVPEEVAVVGLGYVGLPVAVALARTTRRMVGFDLAPARVSALLAGSDPNGEVPDGDLRAATMTLSADPADLAGASIYILTVPTPVDDLNRPDLSAVIAACETVGPYLTPNAIVVLESTVYPGVTEEICGPTLERASGLTAGRDFFLAYSPERINPGDRNHRLETVVKVVSAQTPEALDRVARLYGSVVTAGIHRASSIRVAEAAKVIENIQRDINIALMNELSMIFERLDIPTRDVLEAAGTKWNFLPFKPGLVGGHCIGIDPYYLAARAAQAGLNPDIILAGRRINDAMSRFVAERAARMMAAAGIDPGGARVGILGMTFKENVPDLRNSRVPEVVGALRGLGVAPMVHDALCCPRELRRIYGLEQSPLEAFADLDMLILAVPHGAYMADEPRLKAMVRPGGLLLDLKSALSPGGRPDGATFWSL